ncbi:MAG: hypothetical protein H6716_27380 [Polyangiaceae bacterium]|nr:hypothetical protein [Polyangiaceae bacterium]
MSRASFDALVTRLAESPMTFSERELLEPSHWSLGEDARLREDLRFRETPWGRWMLAEDLVANDAIYRWLHAERRGSIALDAALKRAGEVFGRRCVFCADDPRFVLRDDEVHLAASELSRQPVIEDKVGDLEKYQTHLPLHSLKAAAASEPTGEWGKRAQDQVIETLGWVRVSLPGRRLNDRLFIAAIEGHSMDDGKSGLVDGGYAVFELWPSGTKQNLSVLVRGAFSDPETGNYAVKKYVADQRDAEGRHHKISLVSLNPNRERYPNIELQPDEDEDITVVAKVVQALSTDDYARRPKPKRQVGRRNLTGDEQAARLGRRVASFFDSTAPEADDEDVNTARSTGWQARLVCLDVTAGGLQLEIGPLDGLPSFVKKLRVAGTEWDAVVLAANAKTRPTRTSVRPGTGPWRWEAVGLEEEQDLGLDKLALGALDVTAPTVFRVDADGIGQRIKSTTLARGQAYRLLLPPGVGDEVGIELDGGWRIWALDLAAEISSTTRRVLTTLGLDVGEAWPRLEWALAPAASWRANAHGDSYPVFGAGAELFVNVGGIEVDDGDEAALFLHGPSGTARLPLSSNALVSLGTPAVGRWACALLLSRTSVPSTTLSFEVAEDAFEEVAASYSAVAHSGLASLEATAPPGWPVTLRWRVFASYEETLATLYGNEDGTLPVDGLALIVETRAARTRIADLVVDFGELGRRELPHDGRASLKQVREQLTALWRQRSGLVQSRKGAWLQLRKPWFEPVTELFGYGLEDTPLPADVEAPHDLTAWGLTVDERMMGRITRSPSRVLVLTTDIDAVLRDNRSWVDSACSAAKVRDAIITDGAHWTTHRKGSQQLKQQVWSLDHTIDLGNIDEMLGDLAEGL